MSQPHEATRALMSRRTESPRTILAFHATIIGIFLSFTLAAAIGLAVTAVMEWLIPVILGVGFVCSAAYAVAVFRVAKNDPSKLMLGQVTGQEYADIQRVVLGDSSAGERTAGVIEVTVEEDHSTMAMEPPEREVMQIEESVIEEQPEGRA